MSTNNLDIAALRALLAAAEPDKGDIQPSLWLRYQGTFDSARCQAYAALIHAAVNALPELLDLAEKDHAACWRNGCALLARIDQLDAALRQYGRHEMTWLCRERGCTCGLDAALAGEKP